MANLIDWADIRPGMTLYKERYKGPYPEIMDRLLYGMNAWHIDAVSPDGVLTAKHYDIGEAWVVEMHPDKSFRWWTDMPTDDERRAAPWPEGVEV